MLVFCKSCSNIWKSSKQIIHLNKCTKRAYRWHGGRAKTANRPTLAFGVRLALPGGSSSVSCNPFFRAFSLQPIFQVNAMEAIPRYRFCLTSPVENIMKNVEESLTKKVSLQKIDVIIVQQVIGTEVAFSSFSPPSILYSNYADTCHNVFPPLGGNIYHREFPVAYLGKQRSSY